MTSFQEGEDDEDINTIVTPTSPVAIHIGPTIRARTRQLNFQGLAWIRGRTLEQDQAWRGWHAQGEQERSYK